MTETDRQPRIMTDPPINNSLWARFLTISAVRFLTRTYLRRFWKHPGGVLFISRFCIKIRPFESLAEAHTMRFLAQHTSIPVPKIYCAFSYRGRSFTVMEKIAGERAGQTWAQRSEESKENVFRQLRSMIQQLRALSPQLVPAFPISSVVLSTMPGYLRSHSAVRSAQ